MDKWDKLLIGTKISLVGGAIGLVMLAVLILLAVHGFPIITQTKDVSNLTALIGGSGIALFISLTILMYSTEREKESSKIVSDIKDIIIDQKKIMENQGRILEDQEKFRKSRESYAIYGLKTFLPYLRTELHVFDELVKRLNNEPQSEQVIMKEIDNSRRMRSSILQWLDLIIANSIGAIEPHYLEAAKLICDNARDDSLGRTGDNPWEHKLHIVPAFQAIDTLLERLPNLSNKS